MATSAAKRVSWPVLARYRIAKLRQILANGDVAAAARARWPGRRMPPSPPVGASPAEPDDRPRIFITDIGAPLPERASGFTRLAAIIELFQARGWQVVYHPYDGPLRAEDEAALAKRGVHTISSRTAARRWLASHPPDLAWLARPEGALQWMRIVRRSAPATPIVYDTVDVHGLRLAREAAVTGDSRTARRGEATLAVERELAACADATVVVTAADGDALATTTRRGQSAPPSAVVIPNIHDAAPDSSSPSDTSDPGSRSGAVFTGHYVHTPNVDAAITLADDVWPRVRREAPDAGLHLVGGSMPTAVRQAAAAAPGVRAVGYVPDLAKHYASRRVFACYLRYGAGMKGKVGEAMALGLPVVTTSIGAEGMGLRDGVDVLIADDPDQFAAAVVRVLQDDALWRRLATAGPTFIAANYSSAAVGKQLDTLLERLGVGPAASTP